MITAHDARLIVRESQIANAKISKSLALIENLVIAAAKGEKFSTLWKGETEATNAVRKSAECIPTVYQAAVMSKLSELGYITSIEQDGAPYVPRGLVDDYGVGPEHINLCVKISWLKDE